jgi:recombination protein RecA
MTDQNTNSAIEQVIAEVRKQFKTAAIRRMSEGSTSDIIEVVPTGISVVDNWVLGIGGLPVGRLGEVFSEEGGGKSSFGLTCLAAAQELGGVGILAESEGGIQTERLATFGCDPTELILLEPDTMQDAWNQSIAAIEAIPDGVGPNVFVWDSIAATPLKEEIEGELGDTIVGKRARLMSDGCRQFVRIIQRKRVAAIFINQIREKIGVFFGNKWTTPAGNAVKFHSSWRLGLWPGAKWKKGEDIVGMPVTFSAAKNKFARPFLKAKVRLDFAQGWVDPWSIVNLAKDQRLISKSAHMSEATLAAANKALTKHPDWFTGASHVAL